MKVKDIKVDSFRTDITEYYFYFPKEGKFGSYPATVLKKDKIVATATLA